MGARTWSAIAAIACAACGSSETVSDAAQSGSGGSTATDSVGAGASTNDTVSSSQSSTASSGGAGGKGGAGGMGGGGAGTCEYTSPNDCNTAEMLPDVAGDQGMDMQVLTGTTSKWFQVKILEASNQPLVVKYTVSLASPTGMDFDLFVTEGDADGPACDGQAALGTGEPATVSNSFSDQVAADNSVVLSIEVRYISGTACGRAATWTLTVAGNQ